MFLKKYFFMILPFLIVGCSQTQMVYYPYTGNETVEGKGGFLEMVIYSDEIPQGLFEKKQDYKYDKVVFFKQGLPDESRCNLVGYMSYGKTWSSTYEYLREMTKKLLEIDVNVATQSSISLPITFNDNRGALGVGASGNTSNIYNGYGDTIGSSSGYILFECI